MRDPVIITDAVLEPITLAEFESHSRITASTAEEESEISDIFIPAARRYIEHRTGRTIHEKTLELILDCFPAGAIKLPGATPLIEVESVKYKDSSGSETTWSGSNYVTSAGSEDPGRCGELAPAYGIQYPSFTPYPLDPIRIRYRAGLETASPAAEAMPSIKHAMTLLVAKMWEVREAVLIADAANISELIHSLGFESYIAMLKVEFPF